MTPNVLAYLMMFGWPVFAWFAFRRFRPAVAAMLVMTGGALLLPCEMSFKLPGLPRLDKDSIPPLATLIAASAFARERLRTTPPWRGIEFLVVVKLIGLVATTFGNPDPLVHGPTVLPGLTLHDAFSSALEFLLLVWLPFYLGRALFRTARDLRDLMLALSIAGLLYSFLILIEARFSPQIHNWVYGFAVPGFAMTIRFGGYRPMVFTRHGLMLALFMALSLMATATLAKAKVRIGKLNATLATAYLGFILVVCKSAGAAIFAAVAVPAVALASIRGQTRMALVIATLILSYPILRMTPYFPGDEIVDFFAAVINEERADSLEYRLNNEELLLEHARQHLLAGWGGWGRMQLYDDKNGEQTSIPDGLWVIEVGMRGMIGYLCLFVLILYPVLRTHRLIQSVEGPREQMLLAGLSLIAAFYVADWVPNSSISSDLTMVVGALYSLTPGIIGQERALRRKLRAEAAGGPMTAPAGAA